MVLVNGTGYTLVHVVTLNIHTCMVIILAKEPSILYLGFLCMPDNKDYIIVTLILIHQGLIIKYSPCSVGKGLRSGRNY